MVPFLHILQTAAAESDLDNRAKSSNFVLRASIRILFGFFDSPYLYELLRLTSKRCNEIVFK